MSPEDSFKLDQEIARDSDAALAELMGLKYDLPEDDQHIVDDIVSAQLDGIEVLSTPSDDPGKVLHDYANQVTTVLLNTHSLATYTRDPDLRARFADLEERFKAIKQRIQENVLAQALKLDKKALEAFQLPDDVCLIVIDDTPAVLKNFERILKTKNHNDAALIKIPCENDAMPAEYPIESVPRAVILLDHNLGKTSRGYDLIKTVQEQYPGALILCHTGDATELNMDPENPYAQAGIRVIKKFDLAGIQAAIASHDWSLALA